MDRIINFYAATIIQTGYVRPLGGRRFVAMPIATNIGLLWSPTERCNKLETMEADIQKELAELKEFAQ